MPLWSWPGRADDTDEFPATAQGEHALWGQQTPRGNRGHEGDFLGSLSFESVLEWARAMYFALTGNDSTGSISTPASGHKHDEGYSPVNWSNLLTWQALDTWHFWMGNGTAIGARICDETTETPAGMIAFVVPAGATRVFFRCRVYCPVSTSTAFRMRVQLFAPTNLDTVAIDAGYLSASPSGGFDFGSSGTGIWVTGTSVDVSTIATTHGYRLVYARLDTAVSAGQAQLFEVQACLDPEGARDIAAATLDTTLATPDVSLSASTLKTLFLDTVKSLRQLIFGVTYPLPTVQRAHDHGEGGGETLSRHLLSLLLGPHSPEGGATTGGTIGIPVHPPSGTLDFTTNPKPLVEAPLWVQGGVSQVYLQVAGYFPGVLTRSYTLIAEVRPLSDVGYSPGGNLGQTATATLTVTSGHYTQAEVTLDLAGLGHIGEDRLVELVIWQASNPPAGTDYRLISGVAFPGPAPSSRPVTAQRETTHEFLPTAQILSGQELSTLTARKALRILNQTTYEALRGAPGLAQNLTDPNTADPWRRLLLEPHQHRGCYVDAQGNQVNDGAVVRRVLFAHAFGNRFTSNSPEDTATANGDPVLGQPLPHASGTPLFRARVSIPQGLGAVEAYFLVQPATAEPDARLFVYALARPFVGTGAVGGTICTAARSGTYRASFFRSGSYLICQVPPQEAPGLWQFSATRQSQRAGLWTQDALRLDASSSISTTNPARWSQALRIEISPTETADYFFDFKLFLQVGALAAAGSGSYDESARLLAILLIPAKGY